MRVLGVGCWVLGVGNTPPVPIPNTQYSTPRSAGGPKVLTIGPSESSGATGIQADLEVFKALGVAGVCAVTEVRAADGERTTRVFPVPPRIVEAQIDAVSRGGVAAAKIAGLRDRTLVDAIAERVRRRGLQGVLLDPGIVNGQGERVLGRNGVEWLRRRLLPRVAVVVLRRAEAEVLLGGAIERRDAASLQRAMEQIRRSGAGAVLLQADDEAPGWVLDGSGLWPLEASIPEDVARDRFTAAMTVRLAAGDAVAEAARFALRFVRGG